MEFDEIELRARSCKQLGVRVPPLLRKVELQMRQEMLLGDLAAELEYPPQRTRYLGVELVGGAPVQLLESIDRP